jgi:hypothetical protein
MVSRHAVSDDGLRWTFTDASLTGLDGTGRRTAVDT